MSEEKKSLFDDLPDENKGQEDQKSDDTTLEQEKIKSLDKALKQEDFLLKKKQAELAEKRKQRKEIDKKIKTDDVDEEKDEEKDEDKSFDQEKVIQKSVQDHLKQQKLEDYDRVVINKLRAKGLTRQMAEEAFVEYQKLPKTLGNGFNEEDAAQIDADFAIERVKRLREARRGFTPPSFGGGSGVAEVDGDPESKRLGLTPRNIEFMDHFGISKDDVKRMDRWNNRPIMNLKSKFRKRGF